GADINGCDDRGWTPLMWAAQYDEIEVLRQLLQHGADPNARSDDGRSPLSIARRNEEFKQVLKQAGARGEP
ncbi:MAG: ankyrin repeat domain-containing protein, partial [Planctomycetia bacterium]|nr:ankyrin repeat domain-containing protein [Planctomycetia bacterium]